MPTHEGKCDLCRIEMDNVNVRRGHSVLLRDMAHTLRRGHAHRPQRCGQDHAVKSPDGHNPARRQYSALQARRQYAKSGARGRCTSAAGHGRGYACERDDLVQSAIGGRPSWLGPSREDKERARNLLSVTHVEGLINRRVGALSGGELQRVLLALALDPMPDLLILQEPISGMDQNGVEDVYNMVENLSGKCIWRYCWCRRYRHGAQARPARNTD